MLGSRLPARRLTALLALAFLSTPAPLLALVRCVPDATPGGCDSTHATINLAIGAAGSGDTVRVGPGLYNENLNVTQTLTLEASAPATEANAGNAGAQAIIDGSAGEDVITVSPGVQNVVITGFEIRSPNYNPAGQTAPAGILAGNDGAGTTTRIDILDNVIHDIADPDRADPFFGEAGIAAFNIGNGSTISGNTIYNIFDNQAPTSPGESPGTGRAQGILVKASNGTASGVTIAGNTLHDIRDVAIRYNGNVVSNFPTADITGNSILNVGSPGSGFLSGIGIDALRSAGTVADNDISNVTGGAGYGISLDGSASVSGNTIQNVVGGTANPLPGFGLLIQASSIVATDNLIQTNPVGVGITAAALSGVEIHTSCIIGNTVAGTANQSNGTVDATNNWWGCAAGPPGAGCDLAVEAGAGSTTTAPAATVPICPQLASTTTTTSSSSTSTVGATTSSTTSSTTSTVPVNLNLTRAVIRRQSSAGGNGRTRIKGDFVTSPPGDTFDASADISVRVQDALGFDETLTFPATSCATASSGRRIRCRDASGVAVFRLIRSTATPQIFRFRAVLRDLAVDAPFAGPITATITHGAGVDRVGTISDCRQNAGGLRCRGL